jgi:hypothetical protein
MAGAVDPYMAPRIPCYLSPPLFIITKREIDEGCAPVPISAGFCKFLLRDEGNVCSFDRARRKPAIIELTCD